MSKEIKHLLPIASDIKLLIETSRQNVALAVNSEITLLYWNVGKRINDEVLENNRAGYGKQVIVLLSKQLTVEYGKGWGEKHLRYCMQFAGTFADAQRGRIINQMMRPLYLSANKFICDFLLIKEIE